MSYQVISSSAALSSRLVALGNTATNIIKYHAISGHSQAMWREILYSNLHQDAPQMSVRMANLQFVEIHSSVLRFPLCLLQYCYVLLKYTEKADRSGLFLRMITSGIAFPYACFRLFQWILCVSKDVISVITKLNSND